VGNARDLRRHAAKVQAEAQAARRPVVTPDDRFAGYVGDPCGFAEQLVDPDTGRPFALYPAERRFLEEALAVTVDGALPFPELVYSAPKKSGKTTLAAVVLLYVVRVLGGKYAEGYHRGVATTARAGARDGRYDHVRRDGRDDHGAAG